MLIFKKQNDIIRKSEKGGKTNDDAKKEKNNNLNCIYHSNFISNCHYIYNIIYPNRYV